MGYGQGSISPDPRSGKHRARYLDPNGRQRSKTFPTKTAARKFLADMQVQRQERTWIDPRGAETPFDTWATEWFRSRHTLQEAARYRDSSLLHNHIMPAFGKFQIGRIDALMVRNWVNDLVDKELSPRTIHACHRIFGSIMRAAVAARVIQNAPIGRGVVDLPRVSPRRERFLTEVELESLIEALPREHRALVYAAAYTGCRWQELAGLKFRYLDLDRGILHVRGVIERVGGKTRYKEQPKSDAGRRSIMLPARLISILNEYLEGRSPTPDDWVFVTATGKQLNATNFRRIFSKANEKAGLEPLTFHDLRHTHSAWLIRDGAAPLALQRRLGHRDIRTTMNVYGHLFPNHETDLVSRLDERWTEAKEASESAKVLAFPSP